MVGQHQVSYKRLFSKTGAFVEASRELAQQARNKKQKQNLGV
jgi:hypothetical protein